MFKNILVPSDDIEAIIATRAKMEPSSKVNDQRNMRRQSNDHTGSHA